MLQKVADIINLRMDERRQKLHIHIEKDIPHMLIGDDQRLSQVITNLLSNAIKFTPEEGKIHINCRLIPDKDGSLHDDSCRLQISVEDTGIGIADEQKERVFRSFEQAETGTSRKYGGTGLGLAISRSIVELMDGNIWVESDPGKGSRFIFTVLLKRATDEKIQQINESFNSENARIFAGRKILLVDDVEINREIVLSLLKPTLLEADCAENGRMAAAMFEQSNNFYTDGMGYDLILMDLQMPEMDGYEATRRIRAIEAKQKDKNNNKLHKQIPIIAMTANVFREDIEKCLEVGMNAHIGKPLDIEELFGLLQKYLPAVE
jgi:CheY-like chemotaxis protein